MSEPGAYLVPITSGLTPQPNPRPGGVLNRDRAARLDEQLHQLRAAREAAQVAIAHRAAQPTAADGEAGR